MIKRELEWPKSVLASKIISFFNNKQCGWLFMTMKCSISFLISLSTCCVAASFFA